MAHINTFKNIELKDIIKLKKSGCYELFIGVESGSPNILKKIHKVSDVSKIKEVVNKIITAGINLKIFLIYGFPMESEVDMEMTYQLALSLKDLDNKKQAKIRFSVFRYRPYENTENYMSNIFKKLIIRTLSMILV